MAFMYCLLKSNRCDFSNIAAAKCSMCECVNCSKFEIQSDSVHVGVALQVPPQVVQTGVGLGADLAVVRSDPRVVQHVLLQHTPV